MSMNPDQENFEELRRLLALKRHEQPPPGYFHDFSREVITRIKAGEAAGNAPFLDRLVETAPWLRRLWEGFEPKAIVAGVFGVGVCSLLVVGLISSERIDSNPGAFMPNTELPQNILASVPSQTVGSSRFERVAADHGVASLIATNQSQSSIFDEIRKPYVQPVTFSVPVSGN